MQFIIAWPHLTLIDSGWKDKPWGTEPVYMLAAQAGCRRRIGKEPVSRGHGGHSARP